MTTPWVPDLILPDSSPQLGWVADIQFPEPRTPRLGWVGVVLVKGREYGVGRDEADLLAQLYALERALGIDAAEALAVTLGNTAEYAHGIDVALLRPRMNTTPEFGVGEDKATARSRLAIAEHARGIDLGIGSRSRQGTGRDRARGRDFALLIRARLPTGNDRGRGRDTGTGGFNNPGPIANQYTGNATVLIPPWPRYISGIEVGGGGGGAGGNQLGGSGRGGNAGQWAAWTWDRGAGRNTWTTITIAIGTGGGGGSRNNNGTGGAGSPTTISIHGDTMTAPGGTGGSGIAGAFTSERDGKPPGNYTHESITYNGGTGNGNEPGSGGEGGGGSTWPLNSGSGKAGAKGRAWLRFFS